jgi:hypothetical protein
MSLDMVYAEEWFVPETAQSLGGLGPDSQCRHEAWASRDRDEIDILWREVGMRQGFAYDGRDIADVFAGREGGDDTAPERVEIRLGGYDAREDMCPSLR